MTAAVPYPCGTLPPMTPSKKKKKLVKVGNPNKEKNVKVRNNASEEKRNTVFLKLQNIPEDIIEEFSIAIRTWCTNQNRLGNYVEVCGEAVFELFPLERIKVKQTKEEVKEKKRLYNQQRNQKEEVKKKRREKLASMTEEEKKKKEEKAKDPAVAKRKRENSQDLRRATKRVRREFPDIWNKIRAEVKAERSKGDDAMSIETSVVDKTEEKEETGLRMLKQLGTDAEKKVVEQHYEDEAGSGSETETSETTVSDD